MPNLEELMKTPEEFYDEIDYEVNRMIDIHLTQSECVITAKRAQRQLEAEYNANVRDLEDERRVRRRLNDAASGDVPEITVQSPSSADQSEANLVPEEETTQEDEPDMGMLGYRPTASHLSPDSVIGTE
ncbi:hypothetical protein J4E93_003981 [Alternaria ventricosa]|uniref:uncharacterized protein n=1 Tax=Alternaria ventricosa TaxID=1187951 RepID=UPI0020C23E03|nr:uncharacterized protein J4E93_003981 [Alternaria ventricosa]KAI4649661.1 hypothetical protein J4E93_003981 [Alternaria ventricosa]